MTCTACHDGKLFVRDLCCACLLSLPLQTRTAYRREQITTRQAVDALRTRMTSLRALGGGRRA